MEVHSINIIARIQSDFPTKFGIPRQSGLVKSLESRIIFEPEFRNPDALRGLDGFSHIWLIWECSQVIQQNWSPTVRPPRLGGNTRMGVFATRSPFRPNPVGLSLVKILGITLNSNDGPVIDVSGADLMNGTPLYDIKPYMPSTECVPDALGGFSAAVPFHMLNVNFPGELLSLIPENKRTSLVEVLENDPRPAYHKNSDRIYGFPFAGYEIKFSVSEDILTVLSVNPCTAG